MEFALTDRIFFIFLVRFLNFVVDSFFKASAGSVERDLLAVGSVVCLFVSPCVSFPTEYIIYPLYVLGHVPWEVGIILWRTDYCVININIIQRTIIMHACVV